jgi:hypothetical protein
MGNDGPYLKHICYMLSNAFLIIIIIIKKYNIIKRLINKKNMTSFRFKNMANQAKSSFFLFWIIQKETPFTNKFKYYE